MQHEQFYTILYNPFFIGLGVGQCEHNISLYCNNTNLIFPSPALFINGKNESFWSKIFRNAKGAKSSGQEGAAPAQLFNRMLRPEDSTTFPPLPLSTREHYNFSKSSPVSTIGAHLRDVTCNGAFTLLGKETDTDTDKLAQNPMGIYSIQPVSICSFISLGVG